MLPTIIDATDRIRIRKLRRRLGQMVFTLVRAWCYRKVYECAPPPSKPWQNDWTFALNIHWTLLTLLSVWTSRKFRWWQNDWTFLHNIFKQKKINLVHWTFLTAFKIDWTTLNITEHDYTRLDKVAKRHNILRWTFVQCMFSANVQSFCQGFISLVNNKMQIIS